MTSSPPASRPTALAIFLVIAGLLGMWGSWALMIDKIAILLDPTATLGCNFSLLVQCGANLSSWQGSVFGFPNPLMGLVGFAAVIVVGASILAGAQFARWYWLAFNLGLAGALTLVIWLISQSIFVLGTLCPWCMLVWSVTIPLFITVTLYNASVGHLPVPSGARRAFGKALGWIPFITVLCYIVVAVIAQLRLDVIQYL